MWGTLASATGTKTLHFERHFARPAERVWAALTTAERVSEWMCADAEIDLRIGGRYHLAFRNSAHTMTGEITRLEPPRILEYTWPESAANGNSLVLWELQPTQEGCRLRLTHTLTGGGDIADFGSGWHWHLDALAKTADGLAVQWNQAEWQVLRDDYGKRFAA